MNYNHITDTQLRNFVAGQADEYDDGVAEVLSTARRMLEADRGNELLDERILARRTHHLQQAEDARNEHDDVDSVREELQLFCSI